MPGEFEVDASIEREAAEATQRAAIDLVLAIIRRGLKRRQKRRGGPSEKRVAAELEAWRESGAFDSLINDLRSDVVQPRHGRSPSREDRVQEDRVAEKYFRFLAARIDRSRGRPRKVRPAIGGIINRAMTGGEVKMPSRRRPGMAEIDLGFLHWSRGAKLAARLNARERLIGARDADPFLSGSGRRALPEAADEALKYFALSPEDLDGDPLPPGQSKRFLAHYGLPRTLRNALKQRAYRRRRRSRRP